MRTLPCETSEVVDTGDNVLVPCSSFALNESAMCLDMLTLPDREDVSVLRVTYTDPVTDCLTRWRRHVDGTPASTAVVRVDATTRSSGPATPVSSGEFPEFDVDVDCVSSPGNLTRLGVAVSNRLDQWTDANGDPNIVACFDSVTALLQYAPPQQTLKFLNGLTDRFAVADAVAHYHMEPRAHSDERVGLFRGVFDAVLEYDIGEWAVQSR